MGNDRIWTMQSAIAVLAIFTVCLSCGRLDSHTSNSPTMATNVDRAGSDSIGVNRAQSSAGNEKWSSLVCDVFSLDSQYIERVVSYPKSNNADSVQLILSSGTRVASSSTDMAVIQRVASSILLERAKDLKVSVASLKNKYGPPDEIEKAEEVVMSPTFQTTRRTRVRMFYGPLTFLSWDDEDEVDNITMPAELFLRMDEVARAEKPNKPK